MSGRPRRRCLGLTRGSKTHRSHYRKGVGWQGRSRARSVFTALSKNMIVLTLKTLESGNDNESIKRRSYTGRFTVMSSRFVAVDTVQRCPTALLRTDRWICSGQTINVGRYHTADQLFNIKSNNTRTPDTSNFLSNNKTGLNDQWKFSRFNACWTNVRMRP